MNYNVNDDYVVYMLNKNVNVNDDDVMYMLNHQLIAVIKCLQHLLHFTIKVKDIHLAFNLPRTSGQ